MKLRNLLEKLKLQKQLKLKKLKPPFPNQIKKRLPKMLKPELLEFELLRKTQWLTLEPPVLTKFELLVLTLPLLTQPMPTLPRKKRPSRRDGGGVVRRYD